MIANHKGFSLVELILIVMFLGIFAAIAVPRLNLAIIGEQKSSTYARRISADLRYARQLALSNASDNTVGYGLFMIGSEPYEEYEIRDLSDSSLLHTYTLDEDTDCEGGRTFRFGPLGNLLTGSDTELSISSGDRSFTITIIPATGIIQCTEN